MSWIKQQLRSKIFRRLFLATLAAAEIPVLLTIVIRFFDGMSYTGNIELFIIRTIFLLIIAALVAGMIAIFISRYITQPISDFEHSATKIAQGDFSQEVKVHSNDEIGRLARLFNYMTLELKRLQNMNLSKIIGERNKTQTIIKNIADGVIVTDAHLNILILNNATEHWFDLNGSDATEQPLSEYVQDPRLIELIDEATKKQTTLRHSVEISVKPEGEWKSRVLQARSARVMQEDGDLIGVVTILRDITQQKEIDRMKTELVSMVAHELRSPLTSISGFSELLLDEDTSNEQSREYAEIILSETTRLTDLVNKFLDISRIESGRIQPQKAEVEIDDVVAIVVGNNMHLASKKNISVEVHDVENLPTVYADYSMMEQVFINLFTNAIKYSPADTRIDVVMKELTEEVLVEVYDQGYGIPEEALNKIFNKFYRVSDENTAREETGSGLGLSLVKQIVDMHNGRIEVDSKVNKGSVFSVYLPKMSSSRRENLSEEYSEEIIT